MLQLQNPRTQRPLTMQTSARAAAEVEFHAAIRNACRIMRNYLVKDAERSRDAYVLQRRMADLTWERRVESKPDQKSLKAFSEERQRAIEETDALENNLATVRSAMFAAIDRVEFLSEHVSTISTFTARRASDDVALEGDKTEEKR